MITGMIGPQGRNINGTTRPTDLVQEYTQGELAPLMQGQSGATAGVKGTSQLTGGPKMGLQPRSFQAVDTLVNSGHEASMARIQQRNQLQSLASGQASKSQTAKGLGGIPYDYTRGRQTYIPQVQGSYAQQGLQGGGFGGRSGIRPNASHAFTQMEQAYSKVFGSGIPIHDGFRTLQKQQEAWDRYMRGGPKAARPGTSEHGKGLAVDLGGPFRNANSAQHRWLRQNGARFGWYWTGQAYGEPWHWEYRGG